MKLYSVWTLLAGWLVAMTLGCDESGRDEVISEIANNPVPSEESEDTERMTVAEIKKRGGDVVVDETSPDKPILEIRLPTTYVTDADLSRMRDLTSLKVLVLSGGPPITEVGVAHLKGLTNLETLDIRGSQFITDAALEHLKGMASLKELNLNWTNVTDAGLEYLKELNRLERLALDMTQVTDAGMEHLKAMANLKSLALGSTQISDAGLEHLKELTSLERLRLSTTQISDRGLEHLTGLTNLESLDVTYTSVFENDEGVAILKKALPECEIKFSSKKAFPQSEFPDE